MKNAIFINIIKPVMCWCELFFLLIIIFGGLFLPHPMVRVQLAREIFRFMDKYDIDYKDVF